MSSAAPSQAEPQVPWHGLAPESVAERLGVGLTGLSETEVAERLTRFGPNRLEPPPPPSRWRILLRQFQSPLIYVLLAAAGVALALGELADAGFIAAVLLLNASIGFVNEYRAEREVQALSGLVRTRARVRRGGRSLDIDGEQLVPGDLLMLESGIRVGADMRLVEARGLRIDESVLTGESVPVEKDEAPELPADTVLAERRNMGFAGSMVASGRGLGLVVATGTDSPVSTDSSMRSPRASTKRTSAPTRMPDSSINRSPGTSCSPSMSRLRPPRRTRARVRTRPERACTSRSARYSFTKPMPAFSSSTAAMKPASATSPSARATPAAARRT